MTLLPSSARWRVCAVLVLLSTAATLMPDGRAMLEWQRAALDGGQWLRLLTAHVAHLDLRHLVFNLAGLLLIAELLLARWPEAAIVSLAVASALGTSVLLWFCEPGLQWYTGLSGLLHGLWAGAALQGCLRRQGWLPAGALAALALKLAWLNPGALPEAGTAALPVVAVAHLYGAASGLAWAVLTHAWRRLRHLD